MFIRGSKCKLNSRFHWWWQEARHSRIYTARKEKGWGETSSIKLNLTDTCPTVSCQYHSWGKPGRWAWSPIAVQLTHWWQLTLFSSDFNKIFRAASFGQKRIPLFMFWFIMLPLKGSVFKFSSDILTVQIFWNFFSPDFIVGNC